MTDILENRAAETEEVKAAEKTEGKKKKRSRKKKTLKRLFWLVIILLVLGVVLWSVISKLQAEYRVTYNPYTATTGSISNSLSFTGSMQLVNSASYTASSDAKIREIYVAEGDSVKDGDKLIRLSNGQLVEAEFDGTVNTIDVEKGDEVKAGESLITVADFDHMKVSVRIGESNISEVTAGQNCRVTVSSAGATFDTVIDKTVEAFRPEMQSMIVFIDAGTVREMGVIPSYTREINGKEWVVSGVSIMDREATLKGEYLNEEGLFTDWKELAVNVNTQGELALARKLV